MNRKREDKIKVIYNGWDIGGGSCPFWDYRVFQPFISQKGKMGTGYCTHPFEGSEELECHYGESEIRVPKNCPLKKSKLVQEIELIEGKNNGKSGKSFQEKKREKV
jgi:hypothetical protein